MGSLSDWMGSRIISPQSDRWSSCVSPQREREKESSWLILSFFLPSCIIQYFRLVHGATPNEKSKDCTPQRSLQFRRERYLLRLYPARFGMRCYFAMHRRGRGRNVSPPKNGRRVLFAHHSVYVPLSYLLRNTHVIFF